MSKVISTEAVKTMLDHIIFTNDLAASGVGIASDESLRERLLRINYFAVKMREGLDENSIDLHDVASSVAKAFTTTETI